MPKIYRVMKEDHGKPALGRSASTLGARVPRDIKVDVDGRVQPGEGGMSVRPSLRDLLTSFVPRRLRARVPGALGNNNLFVWSMGEGPFVAGAVATGLQLRVDPTNDHHGFVEPDMIMPEADYQNVLHATQDAWSVDEE